MLLFCEGSFASAIYYDTQLTVDFALGIRTVTNCLFIEFLVNVFTLQGDLASTNAAVRNAAINLMATCHKQLGPGLAAMIRSDVKPALMTALEDAFKSNPQQQVTLTIVSTGNSRSQDSNLMQ